MIDIILVIISIGIIMKPMTKMSNTEIFQTLVSGAAMGLSVAYYFYQLGLSGFFGW